MYIPQNKNTHTELAILQTHSYDIADVLEVKLKT